MSNEELIAGLRKDAGDYGRIMLGTTMVGEQLSWDESNKRAWIAADLLEATSAA